VEVEIRSGGSAEDVNDVVRINGAVFEREYGIDASFASDMAVQLAELRRSGWPGDGEGLWMAELDGRVVGAITLRDLGGGLARLADLALMPEARGSGAGRRLVVKVLEAARAADYERIELVTFSDLAAAREIYSRAGFRMASSEHVFRWGRELDWERWELAL
jgi:ribosomal protein S18 acetylase RimI-like enzyme